MTDSTDASVAPAIPHLSSPLMPDPSQADVPKLTLATTVPSGSEATSPTGIIPSSPRPPQPRPIQPHLLFRKSSSLLSILVRRHTQLAAKKLHRPPAVARPPSAIPKTHLPLLPGHILDDIASYADDRSLWALMAVCRSLRYTAAIALKPRLRCCRITPDPPLSSDSFRPIDPSIGDEDDERYLALVRVVRAFKHLFDVYQPSARLLRDLTVEVRSDDKVTSWGLIRRFAPQLHVLTLHVLDHRWIDPEDVAGDEEEEEEEEEDSLDVAQAWPQRLFHPFPLTFPHLTTLTITSTARTFAHFAQLAPHLPVLRELSLSAHEEDHLALTFDPDDSYALAVLPKLESLTIAGNDRAVAMILRGIIYENTHILSLIIHISNIPPFTNSTIQAIAEEIMSCEKLVKLGLYGVMAGGILPVMVRMELDEAEWELPSLTNLVLEFDRKAPILNSRPDIPSLRYLTFVDKRAGPNGDITLRPRKLISVNFYDEPDLRAVFRHYKHLKRVQWLVGYPTNPFGKEPDWPAEAIACYVDRPGKGGSLEAFRPKV